MIDSQENQKTIKAKKKQPWWLVYTSLLLSGMLLLADAYDVTQLHRWTARLGVALVFSAIALIWARGRMPGKIAVAIIWIAVVISYFV